MEITYGQELVSKEKNRIANLKRKYQQKIRDLETQIANLEKEHEAILGYERTISTLRKGSSTRRVQILNLVVAQPGIRRKAICESLGIDVGSNKAQNISVILTKLVQEGVIRRDDSRAYFAVEDASTS